MAEAHGNRTRRNPRVRATTGFEDRAAHQPQKGFRGSRYHVSRGEARLGEPRFREACTGFYGASTEGRLPATLPALTTSTPRRRTPAARWLAIGALTLATPIAGAQVRDSSRAVIGVFPIRAPGLAGFTDDKLNELTSELHAVIALGSGFLTVPRAAIRKALERGTAAEGVKTFAELDAEATKLEASAKRAAEKVDAAKQAAEIAPDSHEGRAAHSIFRAEQRAKGAAVAAKKARAAADEAKARELANRASGGCEDDLCRAGIAKRVGASKVLTSIFQTSPIFKGECELEARFFDIESSFVELTVRARGACTHDGLRAAVEEVAAELRRRHSAGYDAYKLDLIDGSLIQNKPTTAQAKLQVFAVAQDDPNEGIEIWINGDKGGQLTAGRFETELSLGRYVVVVKPLSPLFRPRRFDVDLTAAGARVPAAGTVTLAPVFGAVQFDLVRGPWQLRSGDLSLVQKEATQIRPGKLPVQFYLEGAAVGEVNIDIAPGETTTVRVSERPRTRSEMSSKNAFWAVRKWGSLALALAAGGWGAERLGAAHGAASDRDSRIAQLGETTVASVYSELRSDALAFEADRDDAQTVALGLLGTAGALAVWSLLEFILGEPDPGALVAPGLDVVPVQAVVPEDELDVAPGAAR